MLHHIELDSIEIIFQLKQIKIKLDIRISVRLYFLPYSFFNINFSEVIDYQDKKNKSSFRK